MLKRILPYALAQFFTVALQWMTLLYLPLHLDAQGASAARLGGLVGTFSLATLALVLPLGILADRLPPRPMMILGGIIAAAANLWLARASSYPALVAGMFADGAGFTLASIALYSLFFKQVGAGRRGMQIAIFSIGGNLGAGVGAWLCGLAVGQMHGYDALFALGVAYAAAWSITALFLPPTRGIAFPILEYGRDLRQPRTWALIAIFFITASHAGFEQAGYGLLQRQTLHLSDSAIGSLFMLLGLWMALISGVSGKVAERGRPLFMTGIALLVSGVFMAASGSAAGAADFLFYRVLHTTGDAVWSLFSLMLASLIFPKKRAGGAFAFAITVNTAAYFLFANAGGMFGQAYGFDREFHLAGLIEVLGGAAILILRRPLAGIFGLENSGVETSEI